MVAGKYSANKGSSLILIVLISAVALFITTSIMNSSDKNTSQISNDKLSKLAYYAAESGLAKATNLFNSDINKWGNGLADLDLPKSGSPSALSNGASYWIESISYINSNSTAIVDAVGRYGKSYRKIRASIYLKIPDIFDEYGLLTDGTLTLHGNKILRMSIHGNNELSLTGTETMENDAIASQSSNPDAGAADPNNNAVGGYVPTVDVPVVPIDDLREKAQEGMVLCSRDPALTTKIINADNGSSIYIGNDAITCSAFASNPAIMFAGYGPYTTGASFIPNNYFMYSNLKLIGNDNSNSNGNGNAGESSGITLYGNLGSKLIFIDGDTIINISGTSSLSNVMIVSSGSLRINGSVDIDTSHDGKVDTIFACQNDITLNGSRSFNALFWTNGGFTQNGSSLAGRVISRNGITMNGSFTLTESDELYDNNNLEKVAVVSARQSVPMN